MSFAIDVVSGSVAMGTTVEGPGRGWPELGRPPGPARRCLPWALLPRGRDGSFCHGVSDGSSWGGAAFRRSKF